MKKLTRNNLLFHIAISLTFLMFTENKILLLTFWADIIPSQQIACVNNKISIDQLILYADTDMGSKCVICANLTQAAKIIGRLPMININVQNYQISGARLAQKFAMEIPRDSYAELVWLHPTFTVSCSFLTQFVQTFVKLTNKKIGIQTYEEWWTFYMGGRFGCPQFGIYPLLNSYYLGQPFRPFGGWNNASLYEEKPVYDIECNNLRENFLHS